MRTLEQLLKSRGYSDAELTALAPTLADPRFRKSLEEEINRADALTAANAKLNVDLDAYDKWFTDEIGPEHKQLLKDKEDLAVELAGAKARLELAQKRGMQRQADGQGGDPAATRAEEERITREAQETARRGQQRQPEYVSAETFQQAFEGTGEAIAMGVDLVLDHQELFGTRIRMEDLRIAAKAAKLPVRKYWEQHFHVAEKRQEMAAAAHQKELDAVRADERNKLTIEFGLGSNPNLRQMGPSNNPFMPRKRSADEKQPWERTESERSESRVRKAYEKAVSRNEA